MRSRPRRRTTTAAAGSIRAAGSDHSRSSSDLSGEVDPDHFRRVLRGQHPHTGEYLVTAQGSAARAAKRHDRTPDREELPELVDSLRAAAHLGVSGQYVRRLLAEGDRYRTRLADAVEAEAGG